MTVTPTASMTDEQHDEHRRLCHRLDMHRQDRIPCRAGEWPPRLWISDTAPEQRRAAVLCQRCPVLDPCRRYATFWPREAGVMGGLTESDRRHLLRQEQPA